MSTEKLLYLDSRFYVRFPVVNPVKCIGVFYFHFADVLLAFEGDIYAEPTGKINQKTADILFRYNLVYFG